MRTHSGRVIKLLSSLFTVGFITGDSVTIVEVFAGKTGNPVVKFTNSFEGDLVKVRVVDLGWK